MIIRHFCKKRSEYIFVSCRFYFSEPSKTALEKYKYHLAALGILFIILILYTLYQFSRIKTLKALKTAQQKEIEANAELSNLFENMPVLLL